MFKNNPTDKQRSKLYLPPSVAEVNKGLFEYVTVALTT